jgi:hypothetical protein
MHGREEDCIQDFGGEKTTRKTWTDGRTVLKRILEKQNGGEGDALDSPGLGQTPVAGSCEHSNETLGSITCWEFPEWLSQLVS